jgi:hypothetical protein
VFPRRKWFRLQPTFGLSRNGVPLTEAKLKESINTGITFGSTPGIINPFHEIEACNKANYRYFHDWQELDHSQKAILVAHYYAGILKENHQQDALNQEMDRKAKRGNRGKKN